MSMEHKCKACYTGKWSYYHKSNRPADGVWLAPLNTKYQLQLLLLRIFRPHIRAVIVMERDCKFVQIYSRVLI